MAPICCVIREVSCQTLYTRYFYVVYVFESYSILKQNRETDRDRRTESDKERERETETQTVVLTTAEC